MNRRRRPRRRSTDHQTDAAVNKDDVRAALESKFADPDMVDLIMDIYDVLEDGQASPNATTVALTLSLGSNLRQAPNAVRYAVAAVVLGGLDQPAIFRRLCQMCGIVLWSDIDGGGPAPQ